jgi:hypothetical protein
MERSHLHSGMTDGARNYHYFYCDFAERCGYGGDCAGS